MSVMMGETSGLVLELTLASVTTASAALLEEAPIPSSVLVDPAVVLRKDKKSLKRGASGLNGVHTLAMLPSAWLAVVL